MKPFYLAFAILTLPLPLNAQTGNPGNLAPDTRFEGAGKPKPLNTNYPDRLFAQLVGAGGMAEVAFGKLAAKASDADVKAFAQRMIHDHSEANDQLKQIAEKSEVSLPLELDEDHKNQLVQLEKLKGAAFDEAYMSGQITDHQKTAQLLEWEIGSGESKELQNFASKILPLVLDHLEMARDLKQKIVTAEVANSRPSPP